MKKQDFFCMIDEIIEAKIGTVKGGTRLNDLEGWDSLSVLLFVVSVEKHFGITITTSEIALCKTVDDLVARLNGKVEL